MKANRFTEISPGNMVSLGHISSATRFYRGKYPKAIGYDGLAGEKGSDKSPIFKTLEKAPVVSIGNAT